MACSIVCDETVILLLSNVTTAHFHEKLLDIVVREGFGNNQKIIEFVSECDQDYYGGMGIINADVVKTFAHAPEQLSLFIPLLDKAINEFCTKNNEDLLDRCKNFRDKVASYYHTISN